MQILQINKYFFNGGGADVVFLDTIRGLCARGHRVAEFSMQNPRNLPSEYQQYFVSPLPNRLVGRISLRQALNITRRLFYSREVVNKLSALVHDFQPQIAHLHNTYHHLSASTFLTLRKLGIPIVMTLHDFFPLCPNHSFMLGETLAENQLNRPFKCVRYRCVNHQFLPSLAATLEAYYYRWRGIWKHVDRFICPSQFMYHKMLEYGYPEKKLRLIYNPFKVETKTLPLGTSIVYLGRLHPEKGIKVFLQAVRELPQFPVIIAGSGPADQWVTNYIAEHGLTNLQRYSWVEGEQWRAIMQAARVVVVPSVFYENCSITILEALSHGRIVVASRRGGNPEMIINGQTGFLAEPDNPADLARALQQAMLLPADQARMMVCQAQQKTLPRYHEERYFAALEQVYQEIV